MPPSFSHEFSLSYNIYQTNQITQSQEKGEVTNLCLNLEVSKNFFKKILTMPHYFNYKTSLSYKNQKNLTMYSWEKQKKVDFWAN